MDMRVFLEYLPRCAHCDCHLAHPKLPDSDVWGLKLECQGPQLQIGTIIKLAYVENGLVRLYHVRHFKN